MLENINILAPFFEDNYRELGVREYARLAGMSPPAASALLKHYGAQGLLRRRTERRYLLFALNNESRDAIDLARIYWRQRLEPLLQALRRKLASPSCVLFGSLAKAEARRDSDADIAVFAPEKKPIDLAPFEKALGRAISLHWFASLRTVPSPNLLANIVNGYVLFGRPRWE